MKSVCSLNHISARALMALGISVLTATGSLGASFNLNPPPTPPLAPANMGIAGVVSSAMSSIARVRVMGRERDQSGKLSLFAQTGTAFLVDNDGDLVTNCHVISFEAAKLIGPVSLTVEFADNSERLPATVKGCDEQADLAVLHVVHVAGHRTPLRFAQAKTIAPGQAVVAIGYGENLEGQPSIANGIISGVNRNVNGRFSDLVQTNAPVNGGNSGGPLLNLQGEVVGVVTYKLPSASGIAYARSANTAALYAEMLIRQGEIRRADFGFTALYVPQILQEQLGLPRFGIVVDKVSSNSPAQRCDLKPGDLIYSIEWSDGYTLRTENVGSLNDALAVVKPGDMVKFHFIRLTIAGEKFLLARNPIPSSEMEWFYASCTVPGPASAATSKTPRG
jgi:serine protease Do